MLVGRILATRHQLPGVAPRVVQQQRGPFLRRRPPPRLRRERTIKHVAQCRREHLMPTDRRGQHPRMRFATRIRVQVGGDACWQVTGYRHPLRPARIRMQAGIEQLEHHHRQREAILRLLLARFHPRLLELRRQIVGSDLPGRETLALALDAETIAIEHRDEQGAAIEPHVQRLEVDHIVLPPVQRSQHHRQIGGEGHLRAQAGRQALGTRLPLLQHMFQITGGRQIQDRHGEADETPTAVPQQGQRPGNLHLVGALPLHRRQVRLQLQHRLQLALVDARVLVRVVELGHFARPLLEGEHTARAATLEQPLQGQRPALCVVNLFAAAPGHGLRPATRPATSCRRR
ncbi:hypothetical protein D3C81_401980 [compost metagenome]